mmetsp:Transcript_26358/g.71294  ORF Transcript_26358/g.71294 Transcript_26358/m.71294 type:complete len:144 (+) Transcript_26358:182-613(+)
MESSQAVPAHVSRLARGHLGVTLLFMDICGYTSMSKEVEPVQVMVFLNTLFSLIDQLVDVHGVHKVETAGDCYIVSGGIMKQSAGGQTVVESHDPAESAHRVDGVCQGNSGLGSSGEHARHTATSAHQDWDAHGRRCLWSDRL